MKLDGLRTKRSPKLMIIPLVDIMFFLLVFFMLSTLYMTEQNVIPVNLPQASASQRDPARMLAVTVTAQGKVLLEREEIPAEVFGSRIQAELARQEDAVFILRADRQAEYGKVVAVMDELKRNGVRRLAVATIVN